MEDEDLELAAAAAYRVYDREAGAVHEPMPADLRDRLIAQGQSALSARVKATRPDRPRRLSAMPALGLGWRDPAWGWLAAAVLAFSITSFVLVRRVGQPDFASLRVQLIQQAPDLTRSEWARPKNPIFAKVHGDVVWSDEQQQGYMRLVGMPVNDPSREQYQLWIVDPDVDKHPVDGGVFDVGSQGEVVIPVHAKLRVDRPTVFAITVERPGGVVVSDGPLEVVAAVGS